MNIVCQFFKVRSYPNELYTLKKIWYLLMFWDKKIKIFIFLNSTPDSALKIWHLNKFFTLK